METEYTTRCSVSPCLSPLMLDLMMDVIRRNAQGMQYLLVEKAGAFVGTAVAGEA